MRSRAALMPLSFRQRSAPECCAQKPRRLLRSQSFSIVWATSRALLPAASPRKQYCLIDRCTGLKFRRVRPPVNQQVVNCRHSEDRPCLLDRGHVGTFFVQAKKSASEGQRRLRKIRQGRETTHSLAIARIEQKATSSGLNQTRSSSFQNLLKVR